MNKIKPLKNKSLKLWSLIVRKRAHYKCAWCGKRSKYNHSHHIVARSIGNPYSLFDLNNGLCLCYRCHIYRIRNEPDEYISIRNAVLFERDISYDKLREMYRPIAKLTYDDYEFIFKELEATAF